MVAHSARGEGAGLSLCPGVGPDALSPFLPPHRWPAAAPRGPAPSPTPTPPPARTTCEGRAAKEGGCRGEGAAEAPPTPGGSGHIPRCCWAPRRGFWSSRIRAHDRTGRPKTWGREGGGPAHPAVPALAWLCNPAGSGGVGSFSPCAQPRGFHGSFCGVILYKYLCLRGVGAGLGSAGPQVLGRGIFIAVTIKGWGQPCVPRVWQGGFSGPCSGGGSHFPIQAVLGLVLGVSPCPWSLDVTRPAGLHPSCSRSRPNVSRLTRPVSLFCTGGMSCTCGTGCVPLPVPSQRLPNAE